MAKPKREVWLAIEEAQSALTILDGELSEGHASALVHRARNALDRAQTHLTDALRAARAAIDKI